MVGETTGTGGFAAAGRLLQTRHDLNLDCDRRILIYVAASSQLRCSTRPSFSVIGALGHQLRHAKSYAALHLVLNA